MQTTSHGPRKHGPSSGSCEYTCHGKDMSPVTNNGSDPFLNGGPYHSREGSTVSGLGLGCCSIPMTPENFLSHVGEVEYLKILKRYNLLP